MSQRLVIFKDFLIVLEPESDNKNFDLYNFYKKKKPVFDELRNNQPDAIPHLFYPSKGGLLPWAKTSNGDSFYLKTDNASPSEWGIVVYDSGFTRFEEFDLPILSFIEGIVTGKVRCGIFPDDLLL